MKLSRVRTWLMNAAGFETPFFMFATAILTGIGIFAALNSSALQAPARLIPFTLLMVVHIGLYWRAGKAGENRRLLVAYLILQGLLAFVLNLLGQHVILIFGLYMALIGIAVGGLKLTPAGIGFILFYLALSLFNYASLTGWNNVMGWAVAVIPTSLFVGLYVLLYMRQSEANKHAQELLVELEKANRQLADYAARVETLTLAAERQRMARELHDTLSQGLAGLILALEAAEAHLANQRADRTATILHDSIAQARFTLAESRRAIDDLRLAQTACPDLESLVRAETQRFTQATGIPVDLSIACPDAPTAALTETIQRTLAEGLTNLARHSHASRCQLALSAEGGWLELRLIDNGVGFDPAKTAGQPGHYGLLGMEERARLTGGTLTVASAPGAGATLTLRLPLKVESAPIKE